MYTHVIVFDVNETLLDLSALDSWFERMFGRAGARAEWFALMLRWSMVVTLCDRFRDFSTLALESLDALADEHGVSIRAANRDDLVQRIRTLPAHADVEPALRRLQSAGLRLVALTNSAQATVDHQLEHAGLAPCFERILSADAVGRFKPHAAVYRLAAETLDVTAADLRMVAAHDWDITGAMAAGCSGAFIRRGGAASRHPAATAPDIVTEDLTGLADAIVGRG